MLFHRAPKAVFSVLGQDLLHNITHLWQGVKEKDCTWLQKDLTRNRQSARLRFESSKSNTTYYFQTVVPDLQAPSASRCGVQIPWQEFKVFLVCDRNDFMSCTLRVLIYHINISLPGVVSAAF